MAVYPVQHTILLPDTTLYLPTERFRALMERFPRLDEKMTLILMRDGEDYEHLTEDSFYPIGLTGTVCEVSRDGWFAVRTSARVHLDEIAVTPPAHIEVYTSRLSDTDDQDPRLEAQKVQELRQQLDDFIRQARWGTMTDEMKEHMKTLRDIAVALSPYMAAPTSERYALLEEDSTRRRCEMIEKMVLETLESARLSQEGSQQQTEEYQKNVRESAIRKQMDYLQKELDEMHPENVSDIRRLEIRIEESGMNETARREADKLIRRLKQEGQGSAETGMLYNYLDFLTSLSWKKEEVREIDLKHAEEILEEDHFGLNKVKNRILQQIAVMNLKHRQSGSILLFVGAPGTGKTSIGQSIARALGREYVRVSLGGVRDEADIRGHRRTYIGSMPGRIMDAIQKSGVSNPVMVLDEVDKLSQSYNGDPASALLEVLDPEQNSTFTDHYMNVPYDLSDVFFICTANTVDTIPEPLLNRMEVIQFQGYTPMEKKEIARKHLLPKAMDAVGLSGDHLQVTDAAIEQVIASYTREGGVRGLKKRMDTLCRESAVRIVRGEKETVTITPELLEEYLDMHPVHQKTVREHPIPGIVTGLAWTQAGGDVLYIETMLTRGSGKIIITGQLGDVMKESAQLAVSLVKHRFPEESGVLKKSDLHIHVPDGATPKDGPSAGITLTLAISSLVTGRGVDPALAMTGEVSLSGDVGPIGGLPEKLMAAHRSGVRKVLIPFDNQGDLRDVPLEVRSSLEIVPVRTVDEALSIAGLVKEQALEQAV